MTERSVFLEALDLPDSTDRAAFLDRACAGDPGLRRKVEELLAAHADAGSFLEHAAPPTATADRTATAPHDPALTRDADDNPPTAAADPTDGADTPDRPGGLIGGRYRVVRSLGEGGMGSVFLAEQLHPVRRQVALKLIKPGTDSGRVVARFEAERQALAVMDHPNIAKVLDAGATDAGRPFFVMELVSGVPLTEFCDAKRLTVGERLGLFLAVCAAVQHAHQKGVIHRDLKPSNVLVTEVDGKPVPKVIDFGLAKALAAGVLPDVSLEAGGSVLGTPLYMAPEQADPGAADIDTRADVYALGVVLYELLTGSTPIARDAIRGVPFSEVLRVVRESEAPAPARRLRSPDLPAVAAARQIDPVRLVRLVRGDLEWITLKCLEKDRDRRYPTAAALAADAGRFLAHEPVSAGPPSRWYRARKFVRRNRGPVAAASLVLLALVGGIVGTTLGLVRARAAETLAEGRSAALAAANEATARALDDTRTAKAEVDESLKQTAAAEKEARRVVEFMVEAFRRSDPTVDSRQLKVADMLDQAVRRLNGEGAMDPLTRARLRDALGETFVGLGLPSRAVPLHEEAMRVRERVLGDAHPDAIESARLLALAHEAAGGAPKAIPPLEAAHRRAATALGPDHPKALITLQTLALLYRSAGRPAEAVPRLEQVVAGMKRTFGPNDVRTLDGMNALGQAYLDVGRAADAIPLQEEALEGMKATLGAEHHLTITTAYSLGVAYRLAGRLPDAIRTMEEVLPVRRAKLGPDHPRTLAVLNSLAVAYWEAGRPEDAIPLLKDGWELLKVKPGPHHRLTLACMHNLGVNYMAAGRVPEAVPLLEGAYRLRKEHLGPEHPDTLISLQSLARVCEADGRPADAEAHLRGLVAAYRRRADPGDLAGALGGLGTNLVGRRKFAEAEAVLREGVALGGKKDPAGWATFNAQSLLGVALLGQRRYAEAEPLLVAGYEGMGRQLPKIPPRFRGRLPEAADRLVDLYAAWGKPDEAARWRAERAKYPPPAAPPPRAVGR